MEFQHEMIHGFLVGEGKRVKPHGTEFQQKAHEINKALCINITTTHGYVSWFRCDGKCRNLKSCLFGYKSQVSNKSSADLDSKHHQSTCGGKFKAIDEPSKDLLKKIKKRCKSNKSKVPKDEKEEAEKSRMMKRKSVDYLTDND